MTRSKDWLVVLDGSPAISTLSDSEYLAGALSEFFGIASCGPLTKLLLGMGVAVLGSAAPADQLKRISALGTPLHLENWASPRIMIESLRLYDGRTTKEI